MTSAEAMLNSMRLPVGSTRTGISDDEPTVSIRVELQVVADVVVTTAGRTIVLAALVAAPGLGAAAGQRLDLERVSVLLSVVGGAGRRTRPGCSRTSSSTERGDVDDGDLESLFA